MTRGEILAVLVSVVAKVELGIVVHRGRKAMLSSSTGDYRPCSFKCSRQALSFKIAFSTFKEENDI